MARRRIVTVIVFSTLALAALGAVYAGSFYLFYFGALQKSAEYSLFYIEQGDYRNCSLITEFYPVDGDVWPFTVKQFSAVYHPLVWRHMKQRRKTSQSDGRPFDLSRTRQHCIDRGIDSRLFDGDLIVNVVRNGPILIEADHFGFRIIADLAQ